MKGIAKQLAAKAAKWVAKKIALWVLGLLGPWGVLILVVAIIAGGFFGALASGDYDADGGKGDAGDTAYVQPYIDEAARVNPQTGEEETAGMADQYRLDWGLLYAIDTLGNNRIKEDGVRRSHAREMAQMLAPKFTYRDACIEETVTTAAPKEEQQPSPTVPVLNTAPKTETTRIPVRLLEKADTYQGVYTFTYTSKTTTYRTGDATYTRIEPVLSDSSYAKDDSRLDAALKKFGKQNEVRDADRTLVLQMAVGVREKRENLNWLLGNASWDINAEAYAGEVPSYLLPSFHKAGGQYGIPWYLLVAIARVESTFRPDAVGALCADGQHAEGLMQFKPSTWSDYGVDGDGDGKAAIFNPHDSIFGAAHYLQALKGIYDGDLREAVKHYGEGTDEYADKVMKLADSFQSQFAWADATHQSAEGYVWPADGPITQHFMEISSTSPNGHRGVDIGAPSGAPIRAVISGTITQLGGITVPDDNGGQSIQLRGDDGNVWYFAHCSERLVSAGQHVEAGQVIGKVGMTGFATGPHLHFELWLGGKATVRVDPMIKFQ